MHDTCSPTGMMLPLCMSCRAALHLAVPRMTVNACLQQDICTHDQAVSCGGCQWAMEGLAYDLLHVRLDRTASWLLHTCRGVLPAALKAVQQGQSQAWGKGVYASCRHALLASPSVSSSAASAAACTAPVPG